MSETIAGASSFVNASDVRRQLRDNDPKANVLLDDLEFTQPEIEDALTNAVDYWNETAPAIKAYVWPKFPYRYNLKLGAIAQLLFTAAHRMRRNDLQIQIAGGTVSDAAAAQAYEAAGIRMWDEYQRWVRTKKYELNLDQGWGSI